MRIIAGSHRGAKLIKLDAADTRPTADRVRESLFNILCMGRFGRMLQGAVVIDAFAGTGALGLEAISRGAISACFIEQDPSALSVLRANIQKLGMQGISKVIAGNAASLSQWTYPPATIMFADAPYYSGAGETSAATIQSLGGLKPDAVIVIETHKSETIDQTQLGTCSLTHIDRRIYGKAALHFITHNAAPGSMIT